ncbi:hypothetical protein EAPG_01052 [Escherichia albertii B156]|nr:hypothetical protein EAPG_01052 [Escherichia albertii B156]
MRLISNTVKHYKRPFWAVFHFWHTLHRWAIQKQKIRQH